MHRSEPVIDMVARKLQKRQRYLQDAVGGGAEKRAVRYAWCETEGLKFQAEHVDATDPISRRGTAARLSHAKLDFSGSDLGTFYYRPIRNWASCVFVGARTALRRKKRIICMYEELTQK